MSAPHLVIFDCDGTLVDGQHLVVAAMERAFLAHGLPAPDPRTTRGVIGLSLRIAVDEVLGGEMSEYGDRVTNTFREVFHEIRHQKTIDEPFYEGARALVNQLAARDDVHLAIATGKGSRAVHQMLETEGWEKAFISIQTADNSPSKPHPGMVLNALAESGTEPKNCVMIGDTTFDMQMARSAGVDAYGVAWGYHDVHMLSKAGAHIILDDYTALQSALLGRIYATGHGEQL
ncbi:MAG: HAD-IA family hydrolase [Pseudomonadota bacterium]